MSGWCGRGRGDPALYPICFFDARRHSCEEGGSVGGTWVPPAPSYWAIATGVSSSPAVSRAPLMTRSVLASTQCHA